MHPREYYTVEHIGHAKYTVNFHDGEKTHKDGSPFYEIRIFARKENLETFVKHLETVGYTPRIF